jgi:hypothetical protein
MDVWASALNRSMSSEYVERGDLDERDRYRLGTSALERINNDADRIS